MWLDLHRRDNNGRICFNMDYVQNIEALRAGNVEINSIEVVESYAHIVSLLTGFQARRGEPNFTIRSDDPG